MTINEALEMFNTLKKEGWTDDEIKENLASICVDGDITLDEFEGLINILGYHLTDEFKKLSKEDQIKSLKEDLKEGRN